MRHPRSGFVVVFQGIAQSDDLVARRFARHLHTRKDEVNADLVAFHQGLIARRRASQGAAPHLRLT